MTSPRLQLKPPSRSDLEGAVAWYEGQRSGLARHFLDEVAVVIERIQSSPLQFPLVHKRVRRALLRRFPYGIFFVIDGEVISVLAIVHQHRDPKVWQTRR